MDLIDREQLMNYIRSKKINIGQVAHIVIMKQKSINAVSEEVYTEEFNLRKDAELKVYKLERALKQESKWIPVSERLPEERGWYLAVFKEKYTDYQLVPRVVDYISKNNWRIIDDEGFVKNYHDILKCVAWMPLPKPYEPQERSDKK